MHTVVRFLCDTCGASFGTRGECSMHEKACGDRPEAGLYLYHDGGNVAIARVDPERDSVVSVSLRLIRIGVSGISEWRHPEDARAVGDAEAVLEIGKALSDCEGAALQALALPPYDCREESE